MKHEILMKDMKILGIDERDLQLLNTLYKEQLAAISSNGKLSNWAQINRGVRQGFVLLPDLFSIYAEKIMRKIVSTENIKINGSSVNNIRYAYDTVLIADSTQGLQHLLSSLQSAIKKRGLTINKKKTKIMALSRKTEAQGSNIFLDREKLDQINRFNYIGSLVISDCRCDKEVRRRIVFAKKAFLEKRTILADKKLSIKLRLRLLKCYASSHLLYSCESWTIDSCCKKKLDALEMWCFRKRMRLSWLKMVSNDKYK